MSTETEAVHAPAEEAEEVPPAHYGHDSVIAMTLLKQWLVDHARDEPDFRNAEQMVHRLIEISSHMAISWANAEDKDVWSKEMRAGSEQAHAKVREAIEVVAKMGGTRH